MPANPFDTAAEVRREAKLALHVNATPMHQMLSRYADLIERVEQLPSPVRYSNLAIEPQGFFCEWCDAEWTGRGSRQDNPHPPGNCLALMLRPAAPTDTGEERT